MPGAIEYGKVKIERIDPRVKVEDDTYLFNIYSCEFNQNTGTTGAYYIPPCPPDKAWVRSPHVIPGTVEDIYPHFQEGEEYRVRAVPGEDIVKAVLGISFGQNKSEDIRRFGVFAGKSSRPTKDELATANAALETELQRLVQEADAFSVSADPIERQSVCQKHWDAANRLKVKRAWKQESVANEECPFCESPVRQGAPKCQNCHEIINPTAYAALKAQMGTA